MLKDARGPAAYGKRATRVARVHAVNDGAARRWDGQDVDELEQGRLTRPIAAQDTEVLPAGDAQTDIVEGFGRSAGVRDVYVFEDDGVGGHERIAPCALRTFAHGASSTWPAAVLMIILSMLKGSRIGRIMAATSWTVMAV